jgi:hypothetical protein
MHVRYGYSKIDEEDDKERNSSYSSSRHAWGMDAKIMAQAFEIGTAEGFSENICGVVHGANAKDLQFVGVNEIPGGVVLHPKMLDFGMPLLVLSQLTCSIIVAVERCWTRG